MPAGISPLSRRFTSCSGFLSFTVPQCRAWATAPRRSFACVVELVMRISGALGLARAWLYGRVLLFTACLDRRHGAAPILFYRREMRKGKNIAA